jgi:hypothetical protein
MTLSSRRSTYSHMKTWVTNIWRVFKDTLRWVFLDLKLVWMSLVPFTCLFLSVSLSDRLRYAGLTLEMLGLCAVAFGLTEKGQQFDRPLRAFFRELWEKRPRYRRGPRIVSATFTSR